ncbi:MAG: hypothetical protein IJ111_14190 [Eggerthellaceae bacterium]|nr:hypothetical protein [Eggerthellaceae bacterium]
MSEEFDKVSHASLNGIYVKAQELDRGHNTEAAPSFAPAGLAQADEATHATTHASDAQSHPSDASDAGTHASSHASDAEAHASDASTHATE